jgi:hypothetical protein
VILQLAYRLRRHSLVEWSLARWLGTALVAAALGTLLFHALRPWLALSFGGLFLAYLLVLAWASRRRYVRFEPTPQGGPPARDATPPPPLRAEEMLPVRASGWFTVEGREQHFVDLEADLETMSTREHIVLARVRPSRFLLLGEWPGHELGWWYVFFEPAMIRGLDLGRLTFGAQPAQALRVIYAPDEETMQTIYLTFEDASALRRAWHDLLLDAPPDVVAPAG